MTSQWFKTKWRFELCSQFCLKLSKGRGKASNNVRFWDKSFSFSNFSNFWIFSNIFCSCVSDKLSILLELKIWHTIKQTWCKPLQCRYIRDIAWYIYIYIYHIYHIYIIYIIYIYHIYIYINIYIYIYYCIIFIVQKWGDPETATQKSPISCKKNIILFLGNCGFGHIYWRNP